MLRSASQPCFAGRRTSLATVHQFAADTPARLSAWNDQFYGRADIEGGDLCAFLGRCVRCLVTQGESFVRLLTTSRGELRLQLLNPEQIDPALNRVLESAPAHQHLPLIAALWTGQRQADLCACRGRPVTEARFDSGNRRLARANCPSHARLRR